MKLLFVCLGNICRSPTAEGVMRKLLADAGVGDVEVDSAGTGDWHRGEPPDPRTVRHAARRGYDLSTLRARQVAAMDFVVFDHVLAMDQSNLQRLVRLAPSGQGHKAALFLDVLGTPGREVPDPWAGGPEDFEHVLDLCEAAARGWLARLTTAGLKRVGPPAR